jgi:hypothetical protein
MDSRFRGNDIVFYERIWLCVQVADAVPVKRRQKRKPQLKAKRKRKNNLLKF